MFTKRIIKEYSIITVGTGIIAAAVYFFMLPSHLSVGSASALAMVISNFVPLPISVITLVLNVTLLIIGFLLIGPEFGAKTIFASILLPGFLRIYEILFPSFSPSPRILFLTQYAIFSLLASDYLWSFPAMLPPAGWILWRS